MTDSNSLIPSRSGIEPPSTVSAPQGAETHRKVGAPPGNNNALKHGFYSRAFTKLEQKHLENDVQGELKDEEECIRELAYRVVVSMRSEKMDHDRYVIALRTVCLAFGRIESIHRSRKAIYDNQTALDQVWEELKLIPPEED
jgi:predicted DNA binding protein